jgi:hypothetical protein
MMFSASGNSSPPTHKSQLQVSEALTTKDRKFNSIKEALN